MPIVFPNDVVQAASPIAVLAVVVAGLLAALVCPRVVVADGARILIENVRMIDREKDADDVVVNILIIDGKLDTVTQDAIEADASDRVVKAQGGFLLGSLEVGEAPSFVIVSADPREEFQVLMDSRSYVQVAVQKGVIVRDNLTQPGEVQYARSKQQPEKKSGWLAYTPPPLALPLSYSNNRKWNRFNTRYVSGQFTGAVALDRQRWLSQDDASEVQLDVDLSEFDGGEIRALRFGLFGTLNFPKPWVYVIAGATNGFTKGFDTTTTDDYTWFDYRLDIPLAASTTLSIGKQKEPISLERLTGMVFLPWQERTAASDALFPSRNHGMVVSGGALQGWMSWAAGAFNNWIDSEETFADTANQLVGRLTWVPLVTGDESNLLHLGLGLRHTDAKQGIRYGTEPEFNLSPVYVDTELLDADAALTWNLEASWRRGPFWLAGEYSRSDVDAEASGDPDFSGYNLSASWALSGEMRTYNKRSGLFNPLPVAKSVNQGGWGAWEIATRWSSVDLTEGDVEGGEMDIWSLGLNWWLTQAAQFSINYRYITLDRFDELGHSSGITSRLLLILD